MSNTAPASSCTWEDCGRPCRNKFLPFCGNHAVLVRELVGEWNKSLAAEAVRQNEATGWVYFVQRQDGAVKIGTTRHPRPRLLSLEREHGPLRLLGIQVGYREAERDLHFRFHRANIRGEWFRPIPSLLRYAEGCRQLPKGIGRRLDDPIAIAGVTAATAASCDHSAA